MHSQQAYGMEHNLGQQIDRLISAEPNLRGAIVGIQVRSATTGQILYDHLSDIRLRPASNMKLLTSAAALNVLGKDYRFKTEVLTSGSVKKKTLHGNLYLKGMGDPTLLKSDFVLMAKNLKSQGIKQIKGNLVGDDNWYDHDRLSKDLTWDDESSYYGAQISALTLSPDEDYDAGSIIVEVTPGKSQGEKPKVNLMPKTKYIKIVNHSKTAGEKSKLTIVREHAKNTVTIEGEIPAKAKPVREWVSVSNPTKYALTVFKQTLAEEGIKLTGKIKTGKVPQTSKVLISHESMPLSDLLVPFMKLSNNGHAEILLKEMGKMVKGEGSWEKGLEVLESEIAKFGLNPKMMMLRDGSGLSHVNLISADQLSQLLFAVQKEKWFPVFLHSLPVSGESERMIGGNLRNRMKNLRGKVKAKTGTLTTVTTLSGYVDTNTGQKLIFSIMINNILDETKGKRIEDQLVTLISK